MTSYILTRSISIVFNGLTFSRVNSTKLIGSSVTSCFKFPKLIVTEALNRPQQLNMSTVSARKHYERLPKTVVPSLYRLKLNPDLVKCTFKGEEDIEVTVKEKTNEIVLNVTEIVIHEASFKNNDGGVLPGKVTINESEEKAFIKFNDSLKTGNGVLSLSFSGILNDNMKGFYRSKYKTVTGEERYAATTQFEAPDARRAFPCWDEPNFKAKFEVTIIAPADRTVLSNTEPVSETPYSENPNYKVVKFAPTPIMSTYLLAFIVGEYDYLETKTDRGTRIRIYTPVGKADQGKFALDVAVKSLALFEKYFNIPFPLSKLDHVGIPDFASGAMENWGLVTYRETRILADSENTSSATRESIAICIAHETAHQWFGNLVTMEWWTDLWLNEGFASFMEYLAVDLIFPEFDIWSQFVTCASLPALKLDSLRNSHPIEVPVSHPDEIDSIFDQISYEKGASIIRMCHDWIGDEAFRKGLNIYLTKHAYGNAVTQDLWNVLESVSGKPVGSTMPNWTKQKGYPVVRVESMREANGCLLRLEQKKFSLDGSLTDEEKQMMWQIPISITTSQDPTKVALSTLMSTKATDLVFPSIPNDSWIKLNPKVIGFYRVDYAPEMLEALRPAIAEKKLSSVDRLQIVSDLFALTMAGHVKTIEIFKLLESYVNEDNYVTWVAIDNCMGKLDALLAYTDLQEKLHKFGIELYSQIFQKLGFDSKPDSSHTENLLRALVLNRLSKFKHPTVIEESIRRFNKHITGTPIHPDIRNAVYRSVASACDDNLFASFFKLYREAELQEEKVRVGRSLGATSCPKKLRQVLEFALSDEVRFQDAWIVVVSCTGSKEGREEAWKFFKENAAEFKKRYGSHHANAFLIDNIISGFASPERMKEIEDFFNQNPFSGHESVILRGMEMIKSNSDWLNRETKDVKDFLNAKYPI